MKLHGPTWRLTDFSDEDRHALTVALDVARLVTAGDLKGEERW